MRSNPTFNAKVKMDPVEFDTSVSGSLGLDLGSVNAYVGEIGVRFAIPFLRPRRKLPLIATVGGFRIRLSPLRIQSKGVAFRVGGVVGTKGTTADLDVGVKCQTEMDVQANVPVKVGKIQVDLCEAADLVE
jgi:hypothetical protein